MSTSNHTLNPNKRTEALGIDIFSAMVAACAVAPGITIVDKGKLLFIILHLCVVNML